MIEPYVQLLAAALGAHECVTPEGLSTLCQSTPLVRIIANPEGQDGRWVRTTGYVVLEFEGMMVCLDRASADLMITENCLWLDLSERLVPTKNGSKRSDGLQKACSNRYVLVEGYVNAKGHGHMGAYPASIQRVERLLGYPLLVDIGQKYHGCSYEVPAS